MPDAKDLSIIDIDLDIGKTPRPVFTQWLSAKVKTAPLEQLWQVLPTLAKHGHHARAAQIQAAIKKEEASRALGAVRQSLGLQLDQFNAFVDRIADRASAVPGPEASDPFALISYERVATRIAQDVALVSSGYSLQDLQ